MTDFLINKSKTTLKGSTSSDNFTINSGIELDIDGSTGIDTAKIYVSGITDIGAYDKVYSSTSISSTGITSGKFTSFESITIYGDSTNDLIRFLGSEVQPNVFVNAGLGTDRLILPYTHVTTENFQVNKSTDVSQLNQISVSFQGGSFLAEGFEELQLNDGYYSNSNMKRNLSIDFDVLFNLSKVIGTKYNDDHLAFMSPVAQYLWIDANGINLGFQGQLKPLSIEGIEYIEFFSSTLYVPEGNLTSVPYGGATLYGIDSLQFVTYNKINVIQVPNLDLTSFKALATIIADLIPPTISISSNYSSLSIGQYATITFTLSEPSTNFTIADITYTGGTLSNFSGSGAIYKVTFTPSTSSSVDSTVSIASGVFSDAAGNVNRDGLDANNKWTFARTVTVLNEKHSLSVIVDKGVLSSSAMLLKGLNESITYTDGIITKHSVEYSGITFDYAQIDSLITTVIRDDEFTSEFKKELTDAAPSTTNLSYKDTVFLVGVNNIDSALLMISGIDGNFVG